jgi:hypothetical protein
MNRQPFIPINEGVSIRIIPTPGLGIFVVSASGQSTTGPPDDSLWYNYDRTIKLAGFQALAEITHENRVLEPCLRNNKK